VTWYDCRCHIPECDGKEAVYQPEWLRYAVPHEGDKPSSCERYASFSAPNFTAGPPTYNETICSPDIFDNETTDKCRDWVFETEEWTIANEVTFVYMSDRFRPYSVQLYSNSCHSDTVYSVSVLCVLFVKVVSKFQRWVKQNTEVIIQIQR
jgi:hypothetical protein